MMKYGLTVVEARQVLCSYSRSSRFSAKITMGRVEVEIRLDCSMENISGVANELVRSFCARYTSGSRIPWELDDDLWIDVT